MPIADKEKKAYIYYRDGLAAQNNGDYSEALEYYKESLLLCLLYTSPSPRDRTRSRMPSSA